MDKKILSKIQNDNLNILKNKFNWENSEIKLEKVILQKNSNRQKINYNKKEINFQH